MKIKSKALAGVFVAGSFLLVAGPLSAHHSQAVYDRTRDITLIGNLTEFEFINPHVLLHLQVKDDKGAGEEWFIQAGAPSNMRRRGWTRNTVKPGDQLTFTFHAARDGSKEGQLRKLSLNGKEIFNSADPD